MPASPAAVPKLARLDRVELAKTGSWSIAVGGTQTFTRDDFAAAIAALDCPAVGRPVVKLGHLDERGPGLRPPGSDDGEPALGWVTNMGLANEGNTLRGDLVGMPGWLGQIAASAYPSRSIEGARNFRCSIGHRHPFVISAVALLGVTPPGVGTLTSLQDHVRALYGVAASSDTDTPGGEPFAVTFQEEPVPKQGEQFAAAVSVEDVRDAFYDGAPPNLWIVDVQLQPPQLIVTSGGDDDAMYRIPYVLSGDDDDEAVTFGTPVPVEVVYQDTAPDPSEIGPVGVAAAAGVVKPPARRAVFARPDRPQPIAAADADTPAQPATAPPPDGGQAPTPDPTAAPAAPKPPETAPAAPADPAAEPEPPTETTQEGDNVSLSGVRSRLGLPDDADEAAVLAALDERLTTPPTPQPDPELVAAAAAGQEAQTTIAAMRGELTRVSGELAAIKAREAAAAKEAFFAAALQTGRLRPADLKAWQARYDTSRDMVVDIVNSMAPGSAVPVAAAGRAGSPDEAVEDAEFAEFDRMFPPTYAPTSAKAV